MKTLSHKTVSRLPASRFPEPAELYFCDDCGRDLTKHLYRDRAPVWQPLRPMWHVCECGQKYLSGAAEWDDLSRWERKQRIWQLRIGFVLFGLLVIPATLGYFAVRYGGAALLAVVGIALIPSILVAKPFWFVLVDLYEMSASVWRTRIVSRTVSPAKTIKRWAMRAGPRALRFTPFAVVIALLILVTRWDPSHLDAASHASASTSSERPEASRQETVFAPATLLPSPMAQSAVPGAPGPEFRRVQVSPNEVDYIAEDVTVRHFTRPNTRPQQHPYKEVHVGEDVTIRYFSSELAVRPPTQVVSFDRQLPLAK